MIIRIKSQNILVGFIFQCSAPFYLFLIFNSTNLSGLCPFTLPVQGSVTTIFWLK